MTTPPTPKPDVFQRARELLALREKQQAKVLDSVDYSKPPFKTVQYYRYEAFELDMAAGRMADTIAELLARCEASEADAELGAYLRPMLVWHHDPEKGRRIGSKAIERNYVAELRCWSAGTPNVQQLANAAIQQSGATDDR